MYYTLDKDGYIDLFIIGEKIPNGHEYKGTLPNDFFQNISAYKIYNDEMFLDEKKLLEQEKDRKLESEMIAINDWLIEYNSKVSEYNCYQRLNIDNNIDMNELDKLAIEKANRLKEIKKELNKAEEDNG